MRKIVLGFLVLLVASSVFAIDGVVNREDMSLKAGPTEPGEGLSLVWVEALVYPKVVGDDRVISLGVKTASKVSSIKASFDFTSEKIALSSSDNLNWSGAYQIPKRISNGVHIVRYQINGNRGSIQRTVEFFMKEPVQVADSQKNSVAKGEVRQVYGWPLTVTSTCTALSGATTRILYSGQKIIGLSKVVGYKVVFEDGDEGWIPGTQVKEPTDDYCRLGDEAIKASNYNAAIDLFHNAIAVSPDHLQAYLGLAKCYLGKQDLDSASTAALQALRIDERDIETRVVANTIAQKYFSLAHRKYVTSRYHSAVAAYRKMLDLQPNSVKAWLEMGKCFQQLGLPYEARDSWREALKYNPENKELHALLGIEYSTGLAAKESKAANMAAVVVEDSLKIVRQEKTSRGTKIEQAVKSVMALTRSLGTPVKEKGWKISKQGNKSLVTFLCEQAGGVLESFDWLVDVDTHRVVANNENARLLMSRW